MQTKDVNKIIELNEQKYISEELHLSEITNSLLKLGFSPKLKGFIYVKEAIYYYSEISFVTNIRLDFLIIFKQDFLRKGCFYYEKKSIISHICGNACHNSFNPYERIST